MTDITVITPSLPSRAWLLPEAIDSVANQTLQPVAHLIGVDSQHRGPATTRNELLAATQTEWIVFLDDDDVLDPEFTQVLASQADGHDVVIPHCRFSGGDIPPRYHNRAYDREALRQHGIFPITTLVRTAAIRSIGGFPQTRYEDHSAWNLMADNGARFKVVPQILWTYRMGHGDHRTHGVNVA